MVDGHFRPERIIIKYKEDSNTGYSTWQISGSRAYNMFIDEIVCKGALDFTEVEDVSDFTNITPSFIGGTIVVNNTTRPKYSNDFFIGADYFDSTTNKPIWWSGTKWIDAIGNDV